MDIQSYNDVGFTGFLISTIVALALLCIFFKQGDCKKNVKSLQDN